MNVLSIDTSFSIKRAPFAFFSVAFNMVSSHSRLSCHVFQLVFFYTIFLVQRASFCICLRSIRYRVSMQRISFSIFLRIWYHFLVLDHMQLCLPLEFLLIGILIERGPFCILLSPYSIKYSITFSFWIIFYCFVHLCLSYIGILIERVSLCSLLSPYTIRYNLIFSLSIVV